MRNITISLDGLWIVFRNYGVEISKIPWLLTTLMKTALVLEQSA